MFETTTDEVLAGVDLAGTVALVTGASTGLGLELLGPSRGRRGGDLGGSYRRAREAAEAAIREQFPDGGARIGLLDLTVQASVRDSRHGSRLVTTASTSSSTTPA